MRVGERLGERTGLSEVQSRKYRRVLRPTAWNFHHSPGGQRTRQISLMDVPAPTPQHPTQADALQRAREGTEFPTRSTCNVFVHERREP
jgi:hypothetical protein